MPTITLELLFRIIGISSASGLIYNDAALYLISDNSNYLYEYQTPDAALYHHALTENPKAGIAKKDKPDFEAIAQDDTNWYVFGSGSTANRNTMVTVNKQTKTATSTDLTNLYLSMQSFAQIQPQDFNIEGVAYNGSDWYFLQRGNGAQGKNGIFTVAATNLELEFSLVYNEIKLPKIKRVRAGFTDGVLVGETLYFLASAEDTNSTYLDGEVLGSLVGMIDINKMKVGQTRIISAAHKLEGISLYAQNESQIEFLLCEDNDRDSVEADIYRLIWIK